MRYVKGERRIVTTPIVYHDPTGVLGSVTLPVGTVVYLFEARNPFRLLPSEGDRGGCIEVLQAEFKRAYKTVYYARAWYDLHRRDDHPTVYSIRVSFATLARLHQRYPKESFEWDKWFDNHRTAPRTSFALFSGESHWVRHTAPFPTTAVGRLVPGMHVALTGKTEQQTYTTFTGVDGRQAPAVSRPLGERMELPDTKRVYTYAEATRAASEKALKRMSLPQLLEELQRVRTAFESLGIAPSCTLLQTFAAELELRIQALPQLGSPLRILAGKPDKTELSREWFTITMAQGFTYRSRTLDDFLESYQRIFGTPIEHSEQIDDQLQHVGVLKRRVRYELSEA